MKEVTTFNRQSVYSDIPTIGSLATFLKYMGIDKNSLYFKIIGGAESYSIKCHPKYGEVCTFSRNTTMYELSKKEVEKLVI